MPATGPIATSPALDLSTLPAPNVVEQLSYEAILAAIQADYLARYPAFSANVESDPIVKLLEVAAYREMVNRQEFNDRARSVFLAFATGADLEHLAALFGVTRLVITPANPATGAAAVLESDTDLRRRVLLAPDSWSVAGPEAAYVYHAMSADPQVLDASATSPAPGEVVVAVLSRTEPGEAPAPLLAAVEAVVNADGIRPLTDQVTVQSAAIQNFVVTATLKIFAGPDRVAIRVAARASLEAYLASAHRLGRDVPTSAIIAALHVGGVSKVVLTAPAADVECTALQAPYCTAINLTDQAL